MEERVRQNREGIHENQEKYECQVELFSWNGHTFEDIFQCWIAYDYLREMKGEEEWMQECT